MITRVLSILGFATVLGIAAAGPAQGTSLDAQGTSPLPDCSSVKLTSSTSTSIKWNGRFEGYCQPASGGSKLKVTVLAVYDLGTHPFKALENATVEGSAGEIFTNTECEKNPFFDRNAVCGNANVINTTPFPMYMLTTFPLTKGLAPAEAGSAISTASKAKISIAEPAGGRVYPEGQPVRVRIVPVLGDGPSDPVTLEWQRAEQSAWVDNLKLTPAMRLALPAVTAAQLMEGRDYKLARGHWRVRARFAKPDYPFGDWQSFFVGEPTMAERLFDGSMPKKPELPTAVGSAIQRPQADQPTAAGSAIQRPQVALVMAKPQLEVGAIAYKPAPLKAGQPIDLSVQVENKGPAKSGDGYQLVIRCKAVSGGQCPVPDTTRALPSIEPGKAHTMVFAGAKPATAGKYELSVDIRPVTRTSGKTLELTVGPQLARPLSLPIKP